MNLYKRMRAVELRLTSAANDIFELTKGNTKYGRDLEDIMRMIEQAETALNNLAERVAGED